MSKRDDFSSPTKTALAKRVANRCSFPDCTITTVGPSKESPSSISNTGMACHISGAASGPGSKRYDPNMTSKQRKSIENGIWMCYTHGKLIDTDEAVFTRNDLNLWKEVAERCARHRQETGKATDIPKHLFNGLMLAENSLSIPVKGGNLNRIIGERLYASGLSLLWGEELAHTVRDLLIEVAKNAISHGHAKKICLDIEPHSVSIVDNGTPFNPSSLNNKGAKSGGSVTFQNFAQNYESRATLQYEFVNRTNQLKISAIESIEDLLKFNPCSVVLKDLYQEWANALEIRKSCGTIYIVFPDFFVPSDFRYLKKLMGEIPSPRIQHFRFVVPKATSSLVKSMILNDFPDENVIEI